MSQVGSVIVVEIVVLVIKKVFVNNRILKADH